MRMNTNIGVIILNYNEYAVTINCVNSFLKQDTNGVDINIVIVDNNSTNESYNILNKTFENYSNVYVLETGNNLGFANGNNMGYKFLKKTISELDFIIISNSDILLPNNGLYDWIIDSYEKYKFSVLGPSIYSVTAKFYQNPVNNFSRDISKLRKDYRKLTMDIVKVWIKFILKIDKSKNREKSINIWDNKFYNRVTKNLTLHGAFQIFSKKYFEYYDEPYDQRTFLYMEEDILKLRCDNFGLKMVYDPSYMVEHLQSASTHSSGNSLNKIDYLRMVNMRNSLRIYMKILKEGRK